MTKEPLLQTVDEREEEEESFMINNKNEKEKIDLDGEDLNVQDYS